MEYENERQGSLLLVKGRKKGPADELGFFDCAPRLQ
jgi:hypothetical protein